MTKNEEIEMVTRLILYREYWVQDVLEDIGFLNLLCEILDDELHDSETMRIFDCKYE